MKKPYEDWFIHLRRGFGVDHLHGHCTLGGTRSDPETSDELKNVMIPGCSYRARKCEGGTAIWLHGGKLYGRSGHRNILLGAAEVTARALLLESDMESLRRNIMGRRGASSVRTVGAGGLSDGGAPAATRLVPQNPLTRLQQIAIDLSRLAEALERESDIDARSLHYWSRELTQIRSEIEESYTAKPLAQ